MSFFSRLFGKKKKQEPVKSEPQVKEEVAPVEPVEEEAPVSAPEVKEEVTEEKEAEVAPEPETAPEPQEEDCEEMYEVRVHPEKGWQVIKKCGKKATRRFPTQSASIEFCKENGYKYEVYKKDGTLR